MGRDPAAELEFRDFVAVRSAALHRTAYLLVGDWALADDPCAL
jgi:RNA polymerase sigma-70 factor (ECF subfamily)